MDVGRKTRIWILAVLLLAGMIALPASAQEANDYPPEVDGEVVDVVDEAVVLGEVETVDVGDVAVTEVRAAVLARTGGDVALLLLGAAALGGLGLLLLVGARRRRFTVG